MELSHFEQQELDKIARGLEKDDPRFARLMSGNDLRRRWQHTGRRVLVALVGLGVLLASIPLGSIPLGVLGFMMMGGGAYWATLFMDDGPVVRIRKKAPNLRDTHEETP